MLFAPYFMERENTAIINVSSRLGIMPAVWVPIYTSTKAGIHFFTRSLRMQLANTNVKVYEILPPMVDVWAENGQTRYSVIGNCEPVGICGSGIIDAVATLLELKLVNKRGRIQTAEERNGQRVMDLSSNIYLTQEDIRQVQMAKGAIATGIHLMCEHLGITPTQIQKVILAGAFGSFLNPDSACRIELLPGELAGRIVAAGNLAGTGAKMVAMNREQFAFTENLCKRIEFIELADMPSFQKTFAKCMMLPL